MDYITHEHFDMGEAVLTQEEYCDTHEQPCFIPAGGWCSNCGNNIFALGGYSVEEAGKQVLTSCPHCGASFVD